MSTLAGIFGALCLVLALVEPRQGLKFWFGERDQSAAWAIAAALFFLAAK